MSVLKEGALAAELGSLLRGEVRFDRGSRALYATDASNYRQLPIGVVIPRDIEDVIKTVEVCRRYQAPLLSRGGGTSLAGQSCNVAVMMDFTRHVHRILEIDAAQKTAWVEPGLILDVLRHAAQKHQLTFGPDPSTHSHCTLGGMIGNNSCGVHAQMAGKTAENIEELEILTYDGLRMRVGATSEEELFAIIAAGGRRGEIYRRLRALRDRYADLIRARYPRIPRRVSGYNLDALLPENGFHVARALVGTEGTCVTVLEAKCRLIYSYPGRSLLVLGYPDIFFAGDHIPRVLEAGPIGLEGIDEALIRDIAKMKMHLAGRALLPEGRGWLLVEFGGEDKRASDERARRLMSALSREPNPPSMKLFDKDEDEEKLWEIRESGLGATAQIPGEPLAWPGFEDSAVPPERVGAYLRELRALLDRYGYHCALYGHFGQGCIHTRIDFDLMHKEGIRKYRAFMEEACDMVLGYGGSLSGEHGDGQARAEFLEKMYGPELVSAFREFKAIWDPAWKMNPGKVVEPYRIDENLRLGVGFEMPRPKTHFQFPEDEGSFGKATLRCVGVGKCRRLEGGTMCPSFMVTHEEKHTTRGRAHLLFEMLSGGVSGRAPDWQDESVKEALDLCLACKGCKRDCPVNVDLATYKAEFLAHYYEEKRRPRAAYAMGLIDVWSRLAKEAPGLANLLGRAPLVGAFCKKAAGIDARREIPAFAPKTFKEWFQKRAPNNTGGPRVILWPDTFTNHFHPEVAEAAVEVLEHLGYQVDVPMGALCCGRPLYDYGMLGRAKEYLRQIMDALSPDIDEGAPIIGLEPSCVAVFRDELKNLFPKEERARKLSGQVKMLSELLMEEGDRHALPTLRRKAVLHGHCHHKAVLDFEAQRKVLAKLGLDVEVLDSGCCGMAGSFGFEAGERYEVSVKAGERVLLPKVREADKETLILTDGFSCQEQIAQSTDRRALHLAQVIQMALREGEGGAVGAYPERRYVREPRFSPLFSRRLRGVLLLAGALGGAWLLLQSRIR